MCLTLPGRASFQHMSEEAAVQETEIAVAFSGKRVLITGHTGFKGGWLALWLNKLGAIVTGVALPAERRSFCEAVNLGALVDDRRGDIRWQTSLDDAIGGQDYDLVIHMAAQALVRASFERPVDTYMTNVIGTAVVLEAARKMPSLKGVIVVTSDKCYDNREWVWGYRENDAMGGHDPYSSSKGCTELVAAAYRHSFFSDPYGPQLATVRAGNVIGGGDWGADRLIPDLMRSVGHREPARLRNPNNIRPWQHVLEPVRGYLMLAAHLLSGDGRFACGWNFGPGNDASVNVRSLVGLVKRGWKKNGPRVVIEERPNEPHESIILRLDNTKARVELGWQPLLHLEDAVSMTVAWYKRYRQAPDNIRQFSIQQIDDYTATWRAAS